MSEIKEIFMLFDNNSDGFVSTQQLGTLVRAINLNPTEAEVNEMQKKVDPNGTGRFSVESLEELIRVRPKETDTLEDVTEALKVFDVDKDGKIPITEFLELMNKFGEAIPEQEIREILGDA